MIRRAIVEEVTNPYRLKVRIPEVDRTTQSSLYISTDELEELTVCVPAGWTPTFKVGDIVIVSYDEYRTDESVVLGFLFREALDSISNATLQDLIVESSAVLPEQTTIGEVKASELKHLSGITGNIQKQLNSLQQQINNIEEKLN